MDNELFHQIESLYHAALEVEESRRAAWLKEICGTDVALCREVESLLAWKERAENFLEFPAIELAAKALARETDEPLTGKTVSHYRILEKLGVGGMGVVYRARDSTLGRFVALKFLSAAAAGISDDVHATARFKNEARAASTIVHPNICTIHEIGEYEGRPFIVMELLEGETLRDRIARGPLKIAELLDFAIQIADGLEAAHARDILHRDLKPANLFITLDNRVKLLDFGLARLPPADGAEGGISTPGVLMGTVAYMSPEQARAESLDARSDLFSFGAVLYEMATGRPAFGGDTAAVIFHAILGQKPSPASQILPDLPPQLDRVIEKALEKDRQLRYSSAAELRADLRHLELDSRPPGQSLAGGRKEVRVAVRTEGTKRFLHRRRTALALAIAAFGTAGIAWKAWKGSARAPDLPPPAEVQPLNGLPGISSYPALRGDGSQIAFSWDGYQHSNPQQRNNPHIYVQPASPGGGEPLQLTSGEGSDISPAWSPDGAQIAFIRTSQKPDESGVYVAPSSGGRPRLLALVHPIRPGSLARQLAWCPDGSLFVADREAASGPFRIIRLLNGSRGAITEPPGDSLGDSDPACSPGSNLLAFVRSGKSWNVKDLHVIALRPPAKISRRVSDVHASITGLAWTSLRELLFASSQAGWSALWMADVETGRTIRIRGPVNAFYPTAAARTVAFSQVSDVSDIWALDHIDKAPHGKPYQLAASTGHDASPELSPDGSSLVFASNRLGTFEIWMADADGRNPMMLTHFNQNPGAGSPHWSPDGNRIAFDCRINEKTDLYVINRNGGGLGRLTDSKADEAVPTWSRDGKAIFFTSTRSGEHQIWRLPLGGVARQVTETGGFLGFEGPDGFLYYVKSRDAGSGIWRKPIAGGAETLVVPGFGSLPLLWPFWALAANGIYFVDAAGHNGELVSTLNFQSFGGKRRIIAHLEQLHYISYPGLTVSATGDRIMYSQIDRHTAEIMLIRPYPER